jgi:chromosome segregation ATPase
MAKESSIKFEYEDALMGDDTNVEYVLPSSDENPSLNAGTEKPRRLSANPGDLSMVYESRDSVGSNSGFDFDVFRQRNSESIANLENDAVNLQAENAFLRRRLDTLTESLSSDNVGPDCTGSGGDAGDKVPDIVTLLSKINELEDQLTAASGHSRRVSHLEEVNRSLQDSVDRKNESTRSMVKQINALLSDVGGLQSQLVQSQQQVADKAIEVGALRRELKSTCNDGSKETSADEDASNLDKRLIRLSEESDNFLKSQKEMETRVKELEEENDRLLRTRKKSTDFAPQNDVLALEVKALQVRDATNRQKIKHLEEQLDASACLSPRERSKSKGGVTAMSLSSSLPASNRPISYNRAKALEADLGAIATMQNTLTSTQDKLETMTQERDKLKKMNELLEQEKNYQKYRLELENPEEISLVDYLNEQLLALRAENASLRQRSTYTRVERSSGSTTMDSYDDKEGSFSFGPRAPPILPGHRKSVAEMQGLRLAVNLSDAPSKDAADGTGLVGDTQEYSLLKEHVAGLEHELARHDAEKAMHAKVEEAYTLLKGDLAAMLAELQEARSMYTAEVEQGKRERKALREKIEESDSKVAACEKRLTASRAEGDGLRGELRSLQSVKERMSGFYEAEIERKTKEREAEVNTLKRLLEMKEQDVKTLRDDSETRAAVADESIQELSKRIQSLLDGQSVLSSKHKKELREIIETLNASHAENATLRHQCEVFMRARDQVVTEKFALETQLIAFVQVSGRNDALVLQVEELQREIDTKEAALRDVNYDYELLKEAMLGMSRKSKKEKRLKRRAGSNMDVSEATMFQSMMNTGEHAVSCFSHTLDSFFSRTEYTEVRSDAEF